MVHAVLIRKTGPPDVLELVDDYEKPTITDGEVTKLIPNHVRDQLHRLSLYRLPLFCMFRPLSAPRHWKPQ